MIKANLYVLLLTVIAFCMAQDAQKLMESAMSSTDATKALELLTQAIEKDPNLEKAYTIRAIIYLNFKEYDKSVLDAQKALELNPSNFYAINTIGQVNFARGNYNEAIRTFTKSSQINPRIFETFYKLGLAYMQIDDFESAVRSFDRSLHLEPEYRFAYLERGKSKLELDNNEGACEDFDKAGRIAAEFAAEHCIHLYNPTLSTQDAEEVFQTGNRLDSDGNYSEALEYVNKSLAIDSSFYQRYLFRAELHVKLGMIDEAIIDVGKCIDRCDCRTRKYHVSSYYVRRANLHIQKGDLQSAMNDVNLSIEHNPERWQAYNLRSELNIQKGEYEKALADLNKSYSINDNEAATLMLRGQVRIELGDKEGACNDLTTVSNWGFSEFEEWTKQNCR